MPASDELELVVPFHFVDDVRDVSIEPDSEVTEPMVPVPGSDERVLVVPFPLADEVDGAPEADEEERVPLYELDIEVNVPVKLVSDEFVLAVLLN